MKKIKWEKIREEISADNEWKTTVYAPIAKGCSIRIISEKKAIRFTSGSRYETAAIYIRKGGALLNHKYPTFAEARSAAERMMN